MIQFQLPFFDFMHSTFSVTCHCLSFEFYPWRRVACLFHDLCAFIFLGQRARKEVEQRPFVFQPKGFHVFSFVLEASRSDLFARQISFTHLSKGCHDDTHR